MSRGKNRPGTFNRKKHFHLCNYCGWKFRSSRPDAKFCSHAHRQAMFRKVANTDLVHNLAVLDQELTKQQQAFLKRQKAPKRKK